MSDMFDNLKKRGGINRNVPDKDDKPRRGWVPGESNTYCQMCGKERSVGSIKASDGTWKRVGSGCKRAMGVHKGTPRDQSGHTGTHAPVRQPRRKPPKVVRVESERLDK